MRPRKCRIVRSSPLARFYKPRGIPLCELQIFRLKDEEWEAIQLADYKGLEHVEAAKLMGISRPTFSRVLASARVAVAKALVEGGALEIGGGDFRLVDDRKKPTGQRSTSKKADDGIHHDGPRRKKTLSRINDGQMNS